jgi:hypothetical protein
MRSTSSPHSQPHATAITRRYHQHRTGGRTAPPAPLTAEIQQALYRRYLLKRYKITMRYYLQTLQNHPAPPPPTARIGRDLAAVLRQRAQLQRHLLRRLESAAAAELELPGRALLAVSAQSVTLLHRGREACARCDDDGADVGVVCHVEGSEAGGVAHVDWGAAVDEELDEGVKQKTHGNRVAMGREMDTLKRCSAPVGALRH